MERYFLWSPNLSVLQQKKFVNKLKSIIIFYSLSIWVEVKKRSSFHVSYPNPISKQSSRHTRNTRPATLSRTCALALDKIHTLNQYYHKVALTGGENVHVDLRSQKSHLASLPNSYKIYPGCARTTRMAVVNSKWMLKDWTITIENVFLGTYYY